jgi:hypothetical protein
MTEMVTSGSMSGGGKRSDGLLGESDYERRRSLQAPPALHATAPFLDSTQPFCPTARMLCLVERRDSELRRSSKAHGRDRQLIARLMWITANR